MLRIEQLSAFPVLTMRQGKQIVDDESYFFKENYS